MSGWLWDEVEKTWELHWEGMLYAWEGIIRKGIIDIYGNAGVKE